LNADKVKWFEIFAVISTGILKFVFIDWLNMRAIYIVSICLFWLIYIYSKYKRNPQVIRQWGIQKQHFKKTFLYLLPFGLICVGGIGIYGYLYRVDIVTWHILPMLILYPFWGLIQQFIVAGLISGNLKAIENPRFSNYQIILLTSLFFSLVHYPSPFLMLFTFIMQWIFTTAFLRWKNIWPLGLYHGWIATFLLYIIMGRDLWVELFAGF
jgi:uncharacterized protein